MQRRFSINGHADAAPPHCREDETYRDVTQSGVCVMFPLVL